MIFKESRLSRMFALFALLFIRIREFMTKKKSFKNELTFGSGKNHD